MSRLSSDLMREYASALQDYLAGGGEDALHRAYELGREAVKAKVALLDMAGAHHQALVEVLREAQSRDGLAGVAGTVGEAARFFAESLSPFEMTYRAFQEANDTLHRLNEELAASNRELEAFSYSVSHDLRAPLRAIDGFSQAIVEDCLDRLGAQGKDYFHRIRAACSRMSAIIDGLLNLSRIVRSDLHIETIDLSALARAIVSDLREMHPCRRVEWVIADGVHARGDGRQLQVVMENLLRNAWKYTSKRRDARIEFGVMTRDGHRIYFVKDNGAGFDMAYADRLFDPFQRLHTTSEFEGLGIGLATVQRIVWRHGGSIWAEAEVELGATFYFTLAPEGGATTRKTR